MTEQGSPAQPGGQTSGSPERAPQQLAGSHLVYDLAAEAAQVRYERGYREGDRNANTLVKTDALRVVLTALRQGARLHEHVAPGWTSVHTLQGRLRFRFPDAVIELHDGRREVRARTASPPERAELWPRITAAYPGYARYQRRTQREIPVVICEPR